MKQFVPIEKCAGKTIESIYHGCLNGMAVLFTDGTYTHLEACRNYGGSEIQCEPLDCGDCGQEIVTMGVATQEELDAYRAEQKRLEAAWQRKSELDTLARLKAKYELK